MDSALLEVIVGLAITFGLFGVVVQVLPGSLIIVAAIAVWAVVTGGTAAWVVLGVVLPRLQNAESILDMTRINPGMSGTARILVLRSICAVKTRTGT